jgi:hypothetical protein
MKTKYALMLILVVMLLPGVVSLAQNPNYSIPWWTVDGGGGMSTGGAFTLKGTIGQPDAGERLTGGSYALGGGFWSGIREPRSAFVYLPMTLREVSPYAAPCGPSNDFCEPNDTFQTAYGPLQLGAEYRSYPGDRDDAEDYYYFLVPEPNARVTIRVTNYVDGQLRLYDSQKTEIAMTYEQAGGDTVMELSDVTLTGGTYYIRVYTDQRYWSDSRLYALTVTLE